MLSKIKNTISSKSWKNNITNEMNGLTWISDFKLFYRHYYETIWVKDTNREFLNWDKFYKFILEGKNYLIALDAPEIELFIKKTENLIHAQRKLK